MGVLVVRIAVDEVEACSDWLWQLGATAIEERTHQADPLLVAGFGSDEAALNARTVLVERWPCRLEDTGDESAWRDEWLRHIEPVQIGSMLVHAPWHDIDGALVDAVQISIDPGRAFGSGHHPTTQLAMGLLQDHVAPGDRVLDAGCGSGILSISAALLGARSVTGVDLDHDILAVAQANVDANFDCAATANIELLEVPINQLRGAFDLVVANIVIGDLRPLLADLIAHAERVAIISGFLEGQFDSLVIDLNVEVVARVERDGWSATALAPIDPIE